MPGSPSGCGPVTDAERAELRGEVNDLLVKFLDCWPPLRPQWRPAPESRLNYDLFGGTIVLAGKVDLALGRAEGTRAGKVLIDLKTGRSSPLHREDLRFYALIETLRLGVPPRRIATHYLDSGHLQIEDVNLDVLEAAVARTVDGIAAMVELARPRAPVAEEAGDGLRLVCPGRGLRRGSGVADRRESGLLSAQTGSIRGWATSSSRWAREPRARRRTSTRTKQTPPAATVARGPITSARAPWSRLPSGAHSVMLST